MEVRKAAAQGVAHQGLRQELPKLRLLVKLLVPQAQQPQARQAAVQAAHPLEDLLVALPAPQALVARPAVRREPRHLEQAVQQELRQALVVVQHQTAAHKVQGPAVLPLIAPHPQALPRALLPVQVALYRLRPQPRPLAQPASLAQALQEAHQARQVHQMAALPPVLLAVPLSFSNQATGLQGAPQARQAAMLVEALSANRHLVPILQVMDSYKALLCKSIHDEEESLYEL